MEEINKAHQAIVSSVEPQRSCESSISSLSLKLDNYSELLATGESSINCARIRCGLSPIEGGDKKLIRKE